MDDEQLRPHQAIYRIASGYIPARALYAATKLGIPDLLGDRKMSISDLAEAAGVQPRALFSVTHLLSHFAVIAEHDDGTVSLTPVGQLLCSDHPESVRPLVLMFHEEIYQAFDGIVGAVPKRSASLRSGSWKFAV